MQQNLEIHWKIKRSEQELAYLEKREREVSKILIFTLYLLQYGLRKQVFFINEQNNLCVSHLLDVFMSLNAGRNIHCVNPK